MFRILCVYLCERKKHEVLAQALIAGAQVVFSVRDSGCGSVGERQLCEREPGGVASEQSHPMYTLALQPDCA